MIYSKAGEMMVAQKAHYGVPNSIDPYAKPGPAITQRTMQGQIDRLSKIRDNMGGLDSTLETIGMRIHGSEPEQALNSNPTCAPNGVIEMLDQLISEIEAHGLRMASRLARIQQALG